MGATWPYWPLGCDYSNPRDRRVRVTCCTSKLWAIRADLLLSRLLVINRHYTH